MSWRWHVAAGLVIALGVPLTMRAWFDPELLPPSDAPGYIAMVAHVADLIARHGRIPVWSTKWFAGSTQLLSSAKEVLTAPLVFAFGPVLGTKLMFALAKALAWLGMYALFVRFFGSPIAGLVAGYAYACGSPANYQAAIFGHLDVAISSALLPAIVIASVEVLRDRRWVWAVALGVLVALQLCVYYQHVLVCPAIFIILLALRPWRRTATEDDPVVDVRLRRRWLALAGGALLTFTIFGGSQLAWLAADARHHALKGPEEVAAGLEVFVEQSPFLYLNRNDWLGGWLATHGPPHLSVDPDDPEFNQRRYLGLVALAVVAGGWVLARRSLSLRRWYQSLGLVLLLQYWLSLGPQTLLWQLARTFHWPAGAEATLRIALTVASIAGLAVAVRWLGRRGSDHRPRGELAAGLALLFFFPCHSLFGVARAVVPVLQGLRSPGHFFDLAPFAFYALLGVALVALARAMPSARISFASSAVVGLLVVADFWPSMHAFERGNPAAPMREFERVLADLPAEDGSLRVAMLARESPTDWMAPSLVLARAPVGAAWSWLPWQAGTYWPRYLMTATVPLERDLDPARRERLSPLGDVFARVGRLAYFLEEVEEPSSVRMASPWTLRASNERFALWERPDVMPMAFGAHSWVVTLGGGGEEVMVYRAFQQNALVVSGGERLSACPSAVVDGAAVVAYRGAAALEDGPSRSLARRYAGKLLAVEGSAQLAERLATISRAPLVEVRHRRPAPEHAVLETDAGDAPALIFLSESYHPWWRATVDGVPTPVVRAETAFLAVPVGPGAHVVDVRLVRPLIVAAADWSSAAAWMILPVLGAGYALRRRLNGNAAPCPEDRGGSSPARKQSRRTARSEQSASR